MGLLAPRSCFVPSSAALRNGVFDMLTWLFKFLICALAVVIVVYVCTLLLGMLSLPYPAYIIILLIIAVGCCIVVGRYLGMPPGGGSGP